MTFIDASAPIAAHAAVKQNVHGVGANDIADVADISTHAAVTTNVHGTGAGNDVASDADITTHAAISQNVHGVGANDIADVGDISTHAAVTTNVHGTGAGNVIVGDDELTGYSKTSGGSYAGNATANKAIAHSLGVTPKFVFLVTVANEAFGTIIRSGYIRTHIGSLDTMAGVTAVDTTNFYVGADGEGCNDEYQTYYWTAYT